MLAVFLTLLVACGDASPPAPPGPTVFAAASLRDALDEVAAAWEASGERAPTLNFAGSNALALQIEAAPGAADVFVSAAETWLDRLDGKGLLAPGTRRTVLSNRLVVIAHRRSDFPVLERAAELAGLGFRHLALADPEAVPAGVYAREYLQGVETPEGDLWSRVAGRVAPAADVRAALALTLADPAIVGVVYRTDARSSREVRVLYEVPPEDAPPIRYGAAVLAAAPHPETARRFLAFLGGPDARAAFARQGFDPAPPGGGG